MPKLDTIHLALGALVLGLAIVVLVWVANWDPLGSKARLKTEAATATGNAAIAGATLRTVDHYVQDVTILHQRSEAATDAIRKAPTSDQPLDPSYRATLCDQLARVRGSVVCVEDHGPVDAAGGLPSADHADEDPRG